MSNLREQTAAKKSEDVSCHKGSMTTDALFIELRPDARTRVGFPVHQLCHYTLEPAGEAPDAPPEQLTLAFPTADVVILGARLGELAELIQRHRLESVSALDQRYAETLGKRPWVAKIEVRPPGK